MQVFRGLLTFSFLFVGLISGLFGQEYMQDRLIMKVKDTYRDICNPTMIEEGSFQKEVAHLNNAKVKVVFPYLKKVNEQPSVNLTQIYELSWSGKTDIRKLKVRLASNPIFEYVDFRYIHQLCYTPNDSLVVDQYYLGKIDAFNAWNIDKGDTTITIGIIDTGWDVDHKDLKNKVQINYADPINGMDDDGDGYIDNYMGWDLAENDNDASSFVLHHGVSVAGLAAAQADNTSGIAGVGFKCRFLPIKIANDIDGGLIYAYDGIVYAAEHGCDIINCSWGSSGNGPFGQDVIDYVTSAYNCVVIGAAGNNANESRFFPAAYNNVLSVINTGSNDSLFASSSYGSWVDIAAPGAEVMTTFNGGNYFKTSGTSMAAPVAAGCAAIVKNHFPTYNFHQVMARLQATADDISAANLPALNGKLGAGRINLFQALTATGKKWVDMIDYTVTDGNNNDLSVSDTIFITGSFCNLLDPVSGLTATITSLSSGVNILDGSTSLGTMNTLDTVVNSPDPFKLKINGSQNQNDQIVLQVTISDGFSVWKDYVYVRVKKDYVNIHPNNIATTITSNSRFGYRDDNHVGGTGFSYKYTYSMLYEGGLMVADTTGRVADNIRGASIAPESDFVSWVNVKQNVPYAADFEYEGTFTDYNMTNRLKIDVIHYTHAYTTPGDSNYIIQVYKIHNIGTSALSGVHVGLYADWDVDRYAENRIGTDELLRLGYAHHYLNKHEWCGIKLLTSGNFRNYAFDISGGGAGGIDIDDGFTTSEKYLALRSSRDSSGMGPQGNDVAHVVSTGPYFIGADDTLVVAFALIGGDTLTDLMSNAARAQQKFDSDALGIQDNRFNIQGELFPNPAVNNLYIKGIKEPVRSISLYAISGEKVLTTVPIKTSGGYNIDIRNLTPGMYLIRLNTIHASRTWKFIKLE